MKKFNEIEMSKRDMRPEFYRYWLQLMQHLGHDIKKFFNNELVYPRQLEIHLPGNHKRACNLACPHCAGSYFNKGLGNWEIDGLHLLNELKGKVPFHIYGGAYTEPLLNSYFMTYMATTKKYNNHFGIHTNGTRLNELEKHSGFLTELNRLSTDDVDYLSVSIDAGTRDSWAKVKNGKPELFDEIIAGVKKAVQIRDKKGLGHAIRLCYLMYKHNDSMEDIESIVKLAKNIGVDSLRFSIPFANYNQDFEEVRKYKNEKEIPMDKIFSEKLAPYISETEDERPYIFYTGPEFTDVDKFDFKKCVYSYYQLTLGADGYYYRCSTTASPTMAQNRIGKVSSDYNHFLEMIEKNHDPCWNAQSCFDKGARCNRMGLEINSSYKYFVTDAVDVNQKPSNHIEGDMSA